MTKVLETFKRVKSYTDKNAPGRDWNLATAMVINGEAGMQLMGDWAKGEFIAAGKKPGKDFACVAAPGSAKAFTFNVDSFAMFKLKNEANVKAQKDLAAAIMSPQFQEVFNLNKGSIPVRLNMDLAKFDDCAKSSAATFVESAKSGGLVPSVAHGMAVPPPPPVPSRDAVSQFWNDDKMSAKTPRPRSRPPPFQVSHDRHTTFLRPWLPKLVVAPSFALSLLFIYGLMA